MKRAYLILFLVAVFILTFYHAYAFLASSYNGLFVVALKSPSIVGSSSTFTATDGAGSAFNTSTIPVNVTGNNPMLLSCWHAEFTNGAASSWEFRYNGVWGRPLFDTDGYHGGAGNRNLRCAYWVGPPAGTHDLVVTQTENPGVPATSPQELTVVAILLNGVAQTFYPFRDTQKDISDSLRTSETETVTSDASDLVIHVVASSLATIGTLDPDETLRLIANDGTDDASLLVSTKTGDDSVTVSSSGWAGTFPLQGLALSVVPAETPEDHIVFTDDFARADESPLSKSGTWTQPAGTTVNPVALVGNKAKGATPNEDIAIVATPTFGPNQRAQITYLGSQYARVWVRVTNAGGYMLTSDGASQMEIFKVDNSGTGLSYSMLGTEIGLARNLVVGDLIELEAVGTALNVYFNGQFLTTRTDPANTYTSGQPGLGSFFADDISSNFQASSLPAHN